MFIIMEDEKAWLRRRYRDAPLEGCYAKRVKFADVSEDLRSSLHLPNLPQTQFHMQSRRYFLSLAANNWKNQGKRLFLELNP